MELLLLIPIFGAIVYLVARSHDREQKLLATTTHAARVEHLRGGRQPAACSWCKTTTLGRKLLVLERRDDGWQSVDLMARLDACPADEVPAIARLLVEDHPRYRRICSERCATELCQTERVAGVAFATCGYCGTRNPEALPRCANCGGGRR